ncbi:hypothetical protein [Bradyrhizobium sp. Rc2d]|uniref:hypothetical protein n=1 Tax=Bradyrhizobium sp. Rc2d TaxID=1855321 RepID=UPI0015A2693C|nr:hypothetical protein [Bradyrhizobium sp. Rc2d]
MTAIAHGHRFSRENGPIHRSRPARGRKKILEIAPHSCATDCAKLSLAGEVGALEERGG